MLSLALAIVKNDGALPTPFLIGIELAEMGDYVLPRPGVGPHRFDQGKVSERFAILGAAMASEKHGGLLEASMAKETRKKQRGRFPLHRQNRVSTTKKPGNLQATGPKIAPIFHGLRNMG